MNRYRRRASRSTSPIERTRALRLAAAACKRSPLALAVAAVLYPPAPALAQNNSADPLEEVIVTATRRELDLQDVAQSVTALSSADIERFGLEDMEDIAASLPSVTLVNAQPGRNNIVMRGVSTGSAEYRTDSQVSVYLDDQPLTSISQQVDIRLIDIARVESLPGPQGTLFGSSSQAGTIRYITNKPDPVGFGAQFDFEGGFTKGGEESYDVSGYVNIPLSDTIAVRATGFYSLEGGYVDNVLGATLLDPTQTNAALVEEDYNDYSTYGGRVAARWAITPEWETTATLLAQYSDADGAWQTDPALGDHKITRFFDDYRRDDWYQASLSLKGDLGFAELSITGSYFDRDIDYEYDQMLYDQDRSYTTSYALYDTDLTFGTTYNWQTQSRWAYEVRLTSLGESRFQWMAGAFYEDVYDWWDYGVINNSLLDTTAWAAAQDYACAANYDGYDVACPLEPTTIFYQNIYDKSIKQKAVFGEVTYALTNRWSVTGGARWFEYDRNEFDIYQLPKGLPAFEGNPTGGRYERSGVDDDVVFKFGTEFHFDDDRMLYFLYSEGFRLGGTNATRAAETGFVPQEFQPDSLQNYELGLKSEWLDDRLQLNVSLFFMQWDDIQINTTTEDPWWVRGTFNAGKAEQKGIELNGTVNLTKNLTFEGSAFLADPEFSEDSVYFGTDDVFIREGTVMPVSPERKYFAAAQYTFPNFLAANGSLWVRASHSYQSENWKSLDAVLDNDRNRLIGSWQTTTLQVGYSHGNDWNLGLVVRNLLDETNVNWQSGTDYGSAYGDPRFRYVRTLQRPRTISLSFTKKW